MSYEITIIVGKVGRDPEMRFTPQGQAVTSFSVATNRQWNDANGQQHKETKWFRVTTWGKLAEICNQYVKKGSKVLVEGRLTADPTTGGPKIFSRQDGTAGSNFELTAATVRFLGGGDGEGKPEAAQTFVQDEEDIPF